MTANIKVTRKTVRLLRHMLKYWSIDSPVTGLTATRFGKVGSGSFYPAVERLEQAGWVRKEWGAGPTREEWEKAPEKHKRPRQMLYFLTEDGARWAEQAVKEYDNRKPWWKRLLKALDDISDGDDS